MKGIYLAQISRSFIKRFQLRPGDRPAAVGDPRSRFKIEFIQGPAPAGPYIRCTSKPPHAGRYEIAKVAGD
jgi:hypothetical protein